VIVEARGAEHGVRVAVDEAREEHPAHLFDGRARVGVAQLAVRAHGPDAPAVDQHGRVAQHLHLRHVAPATRARRPAAGDDLAGADEQRAQSPASRIGKRMPWRRAVASASG